ncbi:hypothetical protein EDD17DRAFT_1514332 [Pisolithus thermaeus]|nr:hypothetical protein EV401DRAFT_2195725 [Pisolithus croceorrhizus]KAI6148187.1 hypothetical protein EDD17DRAFT_1514332 [Pisolithus thermaeus]
MQDSPHAYLDGQFPGRGVLLGTIQAWSLLHRGLRSLDSARGGGSCDETEDLVVRVSYCTFNAIRISSNCNCKNRSLYSPILLYIASIAGAPIRRRVKKPSLRMAASSEHPDGLISVYSERIRQLHNIYLSSEVGDSKQRIGLDSTAIGCKAECGFGTLRPRKLPNHFIDFTERDHIANKAHRSAARRLPARSTVHNSRAEVQTINIPRTLGPSSLSESSNRFELRRPVDHSFGRLRCIMVLCHNYYYVVGGHEDRSLRQTSGPREAGNNWIGKSEGALL